MTEQVLQNNENLSQTERQSQEVTTQVDTILENNIDSSSLPILSTDILTALGDPLPEQPKFGPNLVEDVARIMNTILKAGLKKEAKAPLMEEVIPENCQFLIAPKLNLEIATAVGENICNRDKKIEIEQNQLGRGLSMLSKILSSLTVDENMNRINVISSLCNAIRILADLHAMQTKARKNLTLPALDKQFLNLVKDVERDEYLFGSDLNEKIKAIKNSQKSGNSIKKFIPNPKQGNYSGPSRYHHTGSRTGMRNGPKKQTVVKNYQQKFPRRTNPESRQWKQSKPHAPTPK